MIVMARLRGAFHHRCAIDRVLVLVRAIAIVVLILVIILNASVHRTVVTVSDSGLLLITSIVRLLMILLLMSAIC